LILIAWRRSTVRSSVVAADVAAAPAPRPTVTARWSVAAAASFASRRGAVFTTFALALALTWGSTSRPSGSAASSARVIPLTVASTTVGRVGRTADWFAVRTGHIRRFVTLLADDDAELHDFTVANRTDGFLRVVLDDGRLVHEHILLGVISIDEAITALNIEPFHSSSDFTGDHFLLFVGFRRFRCLLLLLWFSFSHDGKRAGWLMLNVNILILALITFTQKNLIVQVSLVVLSSFQRSFSTSADKKKYIIIHTKKQAFFTKINNFFASVLNYQ
jgi:hypothetical protein